MALDKKFEGFRVPKLLKPCYTYWDYVETSALLKPEGIRSFFNRY